MPNTSNCHNDGCLYWLTTDGIGAFGNKPHAVPINKTFLRAKARGRKAKKRPSQRKDKKTGVATEKGRGEKQDRNNLITLFSYIVAILRFVVLLSLPRLDLIESSTHLNSQ